MADLQRKTANLFDEVYSSIDATIRYKPIYVGDGTFTLSTTTPYDLSVANIFLLSGNVTSGASTPTNGVWLNHNVTTNSVDGYVTVAYRNYQGTTNPVDCDTMLNSGSSPLPYEPYWQHSLRKLTTATDTITTLPADVYADGNNATVGLVGNMVQTGTPTPTTPIQPQETGERTGNLCDITTFQDNMSLDATTGLPVSTGNNRIANVTPIGVTNNSLVKVVFDYSGQSTSAMFMYSTFANGTLIERVASKRSGDVVDVSNADELYICIYTVTKEEISNLMASEGSGSVPYEPYGYKIPISSASTTTPVYLGEVESTRQIKQLVLSSSQNWRLQSINSHGIANFYITLTNDFLNNASVISNYFTLQTTTIADTTTEGMLIALSTNTVTVYIRINSQTASTAQEFKNWLDGLSEEAAIWYVLATPTTGIVNEPIRKIGDYADTVSGIAIPTITGADSFDVLTTLKPSEVSLAYTGWHDASVGEWDGSEWQ